MWYLSYLKNQSFSYASFSYGWFVFASVTTTKPIASGRKHYRPRDSMPLSIYLFVICCAKCAGSIAVNQPPPSHSGTTEEGNCSYLLPLSHRGPGSGHKLIPRPVKLPRIVPRVSSVFNWTPGNIQGNLDRYVYIPWSVCKLWYDFWVLFTSHSVVLSLLKR